MPYGFHMGSLWVPQPMGSPQVPYGFPSKVSGTRKVVLPGFPLGSLWVPYGFPTGSLWVPLSSIRRPKSSFAWVPYGFPMGLRDAGGAGSRVPQNT